MISSTIKSLISKIWFAYTLHLFYKIRARERIKKKKKKESFKLRFKLHRLYTLPHTQTHTPILYNPLHKKKTVFYDKTCRFIIKSGFFFLCVCGGVLKKKLKQITKCEVFILFSGHWFIFPL